MQGAYLEAGLDDGDSAMVMHTLGTITRACGMSWTARDTGLGPDSLYTVILNTFYPEPNPTSFYRLSG